MVRAPKEFSIRLYLAQVFVQFAALLIAIRVLLPALWEQQLRAGPGMILATVVVLHLLTAFVEWGFHRYILHSAALSLFNAYTRGHRHHHKLTPVHIRPAPDGTGRVIYNDYPITREAQWEDSAFPPYALVVIWASFTPILVLAQVLLPDAPVILGGYTAVTLSTAGYEVLHAIEHLPYEWWKRATEHPRFGRFWRPIYGFHLFHHANVKANEAIFGWFGIPVADWVFGTLFVPKNLLLHGRMAIGNELKVQPPRWLVRKLDTWFNRLELRDARGRAAKR